MFGSIIGQAQLSRRQTTWLIDILTLAIMFLTWGRRPLLEGVVSLSIFVNGPSLSSCSLFRDFMFKTLYTTGHMRRTIKSACVYKHCKQLAIGCPARSCSNTKEEDLPLVRKEHQGECQSTGFFVQLGLPRRPPFVCNNQKLSRTLHGSFYCGQLQ